LSGCAGVGCAESLESMRTAAPGRTGCDHAEPDAASAQIASTTKIIERCMTSP